MNKNYDNLTDLLMKLKSITKALEDIWHKTDPITCEIANEQLPTQHLPCDSCKDQEDDNSID